MMQDILNSIKVTMYERFSNPLLGAFLLSVAVFNYRFFLIAFSSERLATKLHFLDQTFNFYDLSTWLRLFLFPLVMTAFYLFVLPRATKTILSYILDSQKELLKIRRSAEDEFPISQADARSLRVKHVELERYFQDILNSKDAEIKTLREGGAKKAEDAVNPEGLQGNQVELWDEELTKFLQTPERDSFQLNLDNLYGGSLPPTRISKFGSLATWGLVERDEIGANAILTEKGKYFAKRMLENRLASNPVVSNEEQAGSAFSELLTLLDSLCNETNDNRKIKYNVTTINNFLESNRGLSKQLDAPRKKLFDNIFKNISIALDLVSRGYIDNSKPYIFEINEQLKSWRKQNLGTS